MDLERKYWFFVRFVKRVLSMCALWPHRKKQSTISQIIYRIVLGCSRLIATIAIFVISYFCWFHRENLELLMRGASSLGSLILICVKIQTFIMDHDRILELVDTLGFLSTTELKDPKAKPQILGLVTILSRFSFIQFIAVGSTLLSSVLIPVIKILYRKLSGIFPVVYLYPLPTKFPTDVEGDCGFFYAAHYIFDVALSWICFSSVIGVDALFCLLVLQLSGQIKVLRFRFENLQSNSSDYENHFRQYVDRHCVLIRCRNNLQKVYGVTILIQFVSNGLVMCALIFQLAQMKTVSIGYAAHFVFHAASKFTQTLMYSWSGTLLTTESEAMRDAVFGSDWINLSNPKIMRNILIVLYQRPLTLKACNFSIVSLDMLTSILHTTISYFFFLQNLDKEK